MPNFPRRADGTHDPYVGTDKGEQIRAVAHVHDYWPLESFPNYASNNLRDRFSPSEIEACHRQIQDQAGGCETPHTEDPYLGGSKPGG